MTAPGRFCCCDSETGPIVADCSDLYDDGILVDTITIDVSFDVKYREPIPSTTNYQIVTYQGSYTVEVDRTGCNVDGCTWVNNDGYAAFSGSIDVRVEVYNSSDVLQSDDSATASVPSDMGVIEPISETFCITSTGSGVPTRWEHQGGPDLSDGLAGDDGNTVFAALIGYDFIRDMTPLYVPQDVLSLEPVEILIPTGTFSQITGQTLVERDADNPVTNELFTLETSVEFS